MSQFPEWVGAYVGLPFEEHGRGPAFDCWGLVRQVLADQYKIAMPDYSGTYVTTNDRDSIPREITKAAATWDKVESAQEGDVIIISVAGKPMHCGLVLRPGYMLHCRDNVGSCVENYDRPQWSSRIEGIYRYRSGN